MAYYPFRNLALKFLAIGLAVLLWFTVSGEPTIVERGLRIPLEFQNIPDGLEIVGDTPDTVDVRVRGSSAILSRLEPGEVVAVLDLRTAERGSRLIDLVTEPVCNPPYLATPTCRCCQYNLSTETVIRLEKNDLMTA